MYGKARTSGYLMVAITLTLSLFNGASIAVYSQHSSVKTKAEEAAAKAAAKAEAAKLAAERKAAEEAAKAAKHHGSSYINPKSYGAVGNGVHDDQAAITAAIAAAQATGKTVYFSAGNYLHSSVIVVNGVALLGAGTGTILTGRNALNCAVELTGNNPSFQKFTINGVNVAREPKSFPQDSAPQEAAIWVNAASNFLVDSNTVRGAAGANGIDISNCNTGTISNNTIANVQGGGINIWGCANVQVVNNSVQNPGIFPLLVAPEVNGSQNITFANNLFQGGPITQGIFLNSVQTLRFTNNNCTTNRLLLFTAETNATAPSSNVVISGNTFDGTRDYGINATSVSSPAESNLTITTNTIKNLLWSTSAFSYGSGIYLSGIQGSVNVSNNTVAGSVANGILVTGCSNVAIHSNVLSNINWQPISVYDLFQRNSGSTDISNNQLSNCCIDPPSYAPWGIAIWMWGSTSPPPVPLFLYTSLSIVGNSFSGPANNAQYFIYCQVPSNTGVSGFTRTISGDSAGTSLLPNSIAP